MMPFFLHSLLPTHLLETVDDAITDTKTTQVRVSKNESSFSLSSAFLLMHMERSFFYRQIEQSQTELILHCKSEIA